MRATVSRLALSRRAPDPRPAEANALSRQIAPPSLQVRPVRHGWRLVTGAADGRWLASANGDGIITVWLAGNGLPLRSWAAGSRVRSMAAGPGDLLVAATDDGRVRAWDVAGGVACEYLSASVPGLTGPGVRVRCLALCPAGRWLAASAEGRLLLWDVGDPGEPLLAAGLPCPAEVTALAFDASGRQLAAGDEDGKVRVWDLEELASAPANAAPGAGVPGALSLEAAWVGLPRTLPDAGRPHSGRVLALAWDTASKCWTSAGPDGLQGGAVDTAANGNANASTGISGLRLRAAALSPEGGFAAVIDDARGHIHLASLDGTAPPRALDGNDLMISGVAFAGTGLLALGGSDGSVRLWDPSRPAMRAVRPAGSPVTCVVASPDGTRLTVSTRRSGPRSFDAASGSLEPGWAAESPEPAECLAFRADGKRLAAAGNAVRMLDAVDGRQAGILPGPTGRARAIAADRDGKQIAAAWAEAVVTVWEGGRLLWELAGHQGAVLAVAFGPRPGLLVSAGDDETIRTWDLAVGREAACHFPSGCRVTVLTASPCGTMLAAGCADGTVRLYEVGETGTLPDWAEAPVLSGHVHGITAMSFDTSGRLLATASRDGTARIWDLAARSVTAVLLPGAAAVASRDGTWRGAGETDGLIWEAAGLSRMPLPLLEAGT